MRLRPRVRQHCVNIIGDNEQLQGLLGKPPLVQALEHPEQGTNAEFLAEVERFQIPDVCRPGVDAAQEIDSVDVCQRCEAVRQSLRFTGCDLPSALVQPLGPCALHDSVNVGPRVVRGKRVGERCAVRRMDDQYLRCFLFGGGAHVFRQRTRLPSGGVEESLGWIPERPQA